MPRDPVETLAVVSHSYAEGGLAQAVAPFEHRVEHRREIAGRGIDDPQHLGGRGLLFQRFGQFGGALLDALFKLGVGFLQIARHAVELPGERFEFVAGIDLDAAAEIAGAEAFGARRNRVDRAGHAARQNQREKDRRHQPAGQQDAGAQRRAVERRERLAERRLDKDAPAERRDRRVRAEHLLAGEVFRHDGRVAPSPVPASRPRRLRERRRDLRQARQVGAAQHQADIGMRDQPAFAPMT